MDMIDCAPALASASIAEVALVTRILSEGLEATAPDILGLTSEGFRRILAMALEMSPNPTVTLSMASLWIAQGQDWDVFCLSMRKKYPIRSKCQEVWTGDHIAYRCRTCGLSDSSCMCVNCFKAEDHVGHDFRIYRCSSGGCCDCGDPLAWRESGFCPLHRGSSDAPHPTSPQDVETISSAVQPVVESLVQAVRRAAGYGRTIRHQQKVLSRLDFDIYCQKMMALIDWLVEICDVCTPLRSVVCGVVVDKAPDPERKGLEILQHYQTLSSSDASSAIALGNLSRSRKEEELSNLDVLLAGGVLLPEKECDQLGVLYLKLLFDSSFKEKYTLHFTRHYPALIDLYIDSSPSTMKSITRFLDRIFCQLFHNPVQVLRIVERNDLITLLSLRMHKLLSGARKAVKLRDSGISVAVQVLDCSSNVVQDHLYSRLAADLRTMLEHDLVASHSLWSSLVIGHEEQTRKAGLYAGVIPSSFLETALSLVSLVQNMDLQERALYQHVEYESKTWQAAFILDHEVMLLLQTLVTGMKRLIECAAGACPGSVPGDQNEEASRARLGGALFPAISERHLPILRGLKPLEVARAVLRPIKSSLSKWLRSISGTLLLGDIWQEGEGEEEREEVHFQVSSQPVSFHIPLHRLLACAISEILETFQKVETAMVNEYQTLSIEELLVLDELSPSFPLLLLEHPLRVLVLRSQIVNGLWARNGQVAHHQVSYYQSKYWHDTGMDLDIMLLQTCGMLIGGKELLKAMIERFEATDILSVSSSSTLVTGTDDIFGPAPLGLSADPSLSPVEEMLRLYLQVVCDRSRIGLSKKQRIRREIIHWLATGNMTASQLTGKIALSLSDSQEFDSYLREVGDFHSPRETDMGNGYFTLKSESWGEIDPFFTHYCRHDLQKLEENYRLYVSSPAGKEMSQRSSSNDSPSRQQPKHDPLPFPPPPTLLPSYPVFGDLPYRLLYCAQLHSTVFSLLYRTATRGPSSESLLNLALYTFALAIKLPRRSIGANHDTSRKEDSSMSMPSDDPFECASFEVPGTLSPPLRPQYGSVSPSTREGIRDVNGASILSLLLYFEGRDDLSDQRPLIFELLTTLRKKDDKCRDLLERRELLLLPLLPSSSRKRERDTSAFDARDISQSEKALSCDGALRSEGARDEDDKRKQRLLEAKARQAMILERMKKQQEAASFLFKATEEADQMTSDDETDREDVSLGPQALPAASEVVQEDRPAEAIAIQSAGEEQAVECALCKGSTFFTSRSSSSSSSGGDQAGVFGLVSFVSSTSLCTSSQRQAWAGKRREGNKSWTIDELDSTQSSAYNTWLRLRYGMEEMRLDPADVPNVLNNIPEEAAILHNMSVHIQCCGHRIHVDCFKAYYETLIDRQQHWQGFEGDSVVDLRVGEFLCPICRRLGNCLIPLTPPPQKSGMRRGRARPVDSSRSTSSPPAAGEVDASTTESKQEVRSTLFEHWLVDHLNDPRRQNDLRHAWSDREDESEVDQEQVSSLSSYIQGCCRSIAAVRLTMASYSKDYPFHYQYLNTLGSATDFDVMRELDRILSDNVALVELSLRTKELEATSSSLPLPLSVSSSSPGAVIRSLANGGGCPSRVEGLRTVSALVFSFKREFYKRGHDLLSSEPSAVDVKNLQDMYRRWQRERTVEERVLFGNQALLNPTDGLPLFSQDLFQTFIRATLLLKPTHYDLSGSDIHIDPFCRRKVWFKDEEEEEWRVAVHAKFCLLLLFPVVVLQAAFFVALAMVQGGTNEEEFVSIFSGDKRVSMQGEDEKVLSCEEVFTLEDAVLCMLQLVKRTRVKDDPLPLPLELEVYSCQFRRQREGERETGRGPLWPVTKAIEELCRPFLKKVSIYVACCLGVNDFGHPSGQGRSCLRSPDAFEDVFWLTSYLGLPPVTQVFSRQYLQETHRSLLPAWFTQMESCAAKLGSRGGGRGGVLAVLPPFYSSASLSLMRLPYLYTDVFINYCQKSLCAFCQAIPEHPALCLLCGTLVCCHSSSCKLDGIGACSAHALSCGGGYSAFLLVRACTVLLLLGGERRCVWGSLYLDNNGEEDRNLRRGKALYLNEARYEQLRRLVAMHRFAHDTRVLAHTTRRDGEQF